LQEQVASQAYSKKDIERLKYERAHLRRMLEDLKIDTEKADQKIWELGIEESRLEECISRTDRYVNDKAEAVESALVAVDGPSVQELVCRIDLTEPTDALAALDFGELAGRLDKAAEAHVESRRLEEVAIHEVGEEQRVAQEELCEKDKEIRRLKTRLEQLTRMREEYRVWNDADLDEARQTAEAAEDAVRAASISTAAPSLRDVAEVDDLRLHLSELKSRCEGDRVFMEEKIRREQELCHVHQQSVQKEIRLAAESITQLREDVEKRVKDVGTEDIPEASSHRHTSRGGC